MKNVGPPHTGFYYLLILAAIFESTFGETMEVCTSEEVSVSCPHSHIIFTKSAQFGRMEVGRCITEEDEFLGCRNEVLQLLDSWCSGRQRCHIKVSNPELEAANKNCLKILKLYLRFEYDCLQVDLKCRSNQPNYLSARNGYVTSLAADMGTCASVGSTWIISTDPGQIIKLDVIDFSQMVETANLVSCGTVYGFVLERSLGINKTICGGLHREVALYTSKTNSVEIRLLSRKKRGDGKFLIKYIVSGCPEISPNPHSWYKREGNEAVIGCENSDKEWRLKCIGNKWIGEVGNCSQIGHGDVAKHEVLRPSSIDFLTVVAISGISGAAVVLSVIAIVSGVVYINKYRMKQEIKRANLYKTYSTLGRNQQMYFRPTDLDQSIDSGACWDMSLPPEQQRMMLHPEVCTCSTLQTCCHGNESKVVGKSAEERQSLYSSIKST